jgi:Ca-activated chloride channel family protein
MSTSRKAILPLVACLIAGLPTLTGQDQGPNKEGSETVARPRTKSGTAEPTLGPKIPSKFEKKPEAPEGTPNFKTNVTAVTVDVAVVDNKGRFIPNIPRGNFRVLEDAVPQQISGFNMGEAPMTVAMVIEFSGRWQNFYTETWYQTLTAAYGFIETLKPEDYVAIIAYDMHTKILCDFTADKSEVQAAMHRLQIPGFSESNLFDALAFTAERMTEIEGRKAILAITSGDDTFSKLTLDKVRKILQNAGVPIYAIGIGQAIREYYDAHGMLGPIALMDALQADNQLKTFAKETGGQAFLPRFYGEFPGIFRAIAEALRNQYSLVYNPTNQARDGTVRKISVQLVNPATGEPLKIAVNGKPVKYSIIAKSGYTAPREVE